MVKGATANVMEDQEKDLLRAFRSRLFDVQTELDKERTKKDDSASHWISELTPHTIGILGGRLTIPRSFCYAFARADKTRQLEAEIDWATAMADELAKKNTSLRQEQKDLVAK